MRGAHATLFFDLVLSSMLVVVVLLSLQKLSDQTGDDEDRWAPAQFAPIVVQGAFDCEGIVAGAAESRDRLEALPSKFGPVFQLSIISDAQSQLACRAPWPVFFIAPLSTEAAAYWICPPGKNGAAELRAWRNAPEASLTYECDRGVSGSTSYPLDLNKLREVGVAKFPEAFSQPGGPT